MRQAQGGRLQCEARQLATCTNVVLPDPAIPRHTMQAFFLVLVLSPACAPSGALGGSSAGAVCLGSAAEERASVSIPSAILYLDWKWDQAEHMHGENG